MMEDLTAFLTRLPKVELHVHLESTMPGELLERFAARQGKRLPRPADRLYDCSAEDLSDFLAFLDRICAYVGTPQELAEAAEDPNLVERLARERVPLNICLTSNLTLLYRRPEDHPLRRLLDAGAAVTLNRDDPTFLGGLTLTEELRRAAEFASMTRQELIRCQENAVDAAFCGAETKAALREALTEFQRG